MIERGAGRSPRRGDALRKVLLERGLLPAAAAFTPFETHRHLRAMLAADFDDPAEERRERLGRVLRHAATETALYRDRLRTSDPSEIERLASPEGFATIPITRKADLRRDFPRRQLAASHAGAWLRYSNTSGTTGRPLLLIQDADDISAKYASILRSRVLAGVDPMSSQARITPNECQPAMPVDAGGPRPRTRLSGLRQAAFRSLERRVVNPYFQRRMMLPPFWGSGAVTDPVDFDRYFDRIERFDPEVLTLYPLYALLLADALERSGRPPPTRRGVVDFSAALCTPSMRARIERAFGLPSAQGCGGCEFARYGASCTVDPDRMHLAETFCYVETVRPDGTRCEPGELGNVLVTSLHSWAMPVIRLEPGDVARIIDEPCGCGRTSRRIEHHGRVHSLLQGADGRWVSGRDVWERLFAVRGISLFELRQRTETEYAVAVVVGPGTALDRAALDAALSELLGSDAAVSIETVPHLTTQASGKLQLVHSATFDRFRVPEVRGLDAPVN